MRTIVTIFVIFLARCEYLSARPEPGREAVGEFLHSDSCIFGAKSISPYLYNRYSTAKVVKKENICNNVNSSTQIVFIIHGFISSANTINMKNLAKQLTQKGYTVFAMDWSQGACTEGIPIIKLLQYPSAVENTREIGQFIARNISSLIKNCDVSLENITLIGHSLGAHVSGFAAKEIQNMSLGTIPLIIAADPADPLLGKNKCEDRLCKTDAKKVNVLHTSSLGIKYPVGHLDLQIHNGMMQPGCGINVACSHTRSIDYITCMIENCGFLGVPLEKKSIFQREPPYPSSNTTNCIFMNSNILDSNNPIEGQYYVFVNDDEPYCTKTTFKCKQ